MFESNSEDNVFRRRLMKEVAPGVPVHLSFYSPSVKVQVMHPAENLPGANGRYIGDAVTIEVVPEDAAAVERVREYVWHWEDYNAFTAVRKIDHLRRSVCPDSVQGVLERVRGVDKRAAAKTAEVLDYEELQDILLRGDFKTLARLPGMGEKRARAVVEFYDNERSGRRFLYAANRNDRFRGKPVITELDLEGDLEEQVWDHAVRARRLGNPDPLGPEEPPGHTTVRNANLLHPLPMTPSLMGRGVYYPEQIELFADTLRRVIVDGETLAGVDALRIQRGKLFHTTKMAGVGMKTRARVMASGLLDDEYTYDSLAAIPGVTQTQARTIADAGSLPLDEAPYVVFDVETTGSAAGKGGAITEFGAMKLVRGEVVDQFSTLVNPGRPIDPFVVRLTGITDRMVADAPSISEAMPRFEEFVEGCVLVGHNVHFDCSFVTAARGGVKLPNEVLDTLKLARCLVPGLKRYRLSSLVNHFGVRHAPNHRALSDAAATTEVFRRLLKLLSSAGVESVGEALAIRGGRGRIKPQKQHLASGVPNTPGVYYFIDKHGTTLYVGKAKDLKARVRTYFNGGDGRRKVGRLVEEVAEVRVKETESELHALILEAREIRRLLPRYNSVGRDDKGGWFIRLDTTEPYPLPERVPTKDSKDGVIHLGPYRSAGVLDACIEALGRIFPLKRCSGEEGICFYGQMGRCAPCIGMGRDDYRHLVVDEVVALLRGEGGEEHLAALVGERERLAGALEFEAAARLRDLIAGIDRIRLARAVVSADGVQAVVAASTEPGVVEVFVLFRGRLVAHEGFDAGDLAGLSRFAEGALARCEGAGEPPADGGEAGVEARVVAAYLKRRSAAIEAVR